MRSAALILSLLLLSAAPPSESAPAPAAAAATPQVSADAPTLDLPETVDGPVGGFITVAAETNGTVVRWHAIDPGLNLFPVELLRDSRAAVVTSSRAGRYRLLAYTALGDVPSDPETVTVIVGDAPPVPPGPQPPGPTPPGPVPPEPQPDAAPFPADGLHVLIVYETAKVGDLTAEQRAIILGTDVRGALDAAAPKRYRIYDQDADLQFVPQVWKDAMAVPRQSLPWLAISNGKTGFSGPLTMTAAEFRKMLEEYK
jgi:hypothetical protein